MTLSIIGGDDGQPFATEAERNNHIREFYVNLYKLPADKPANLAGCVEKCLGPDICNHPTVLGMKLNLEEKNKLDQPISLLELDNAMKSSNKKSAPGIDGASNVMISKIWDLVRVPLHKYAACCFSNAAKNVLPFYPFQ